MAKGTGKARRTRVERGIYQRADGTLEVCYQDSTGRTRWQTVGTKITQARAVRRDLMARKDRGEHVQPNPRLRFGDAADRWLKGQVSDLRPATQAIYRNAIETHLRRRWGLHRLDAITVDDVAALVRELRTEGKSEWTIAGILKAASRVFKYAQRRLHWHGTNPVDGLENGERPKTGSTARRRIFRGDELGQTLAASREPYRTLFMLASVTGARLSEVLGLTWADVALDDPDTAEVAIVAQVDRQGRRQALKTQESRRTVEIPRALAAMLAQHKLASGDGRPEAFVFATRTGRPISQRNIMRALRNAQGRATDEHGRPTFPALQERDAKGRPVPVAHGAIPSFHSFRHTAASEAISAGESAEEVSWQLGHKSSVVTRAVYTQEIKSAERTAHRRAKMDARLGKIMESADRSREAAEASKGAGRVVNLVPADDARQ